MRASAYVKGFFYTASRLTNKPIVSLLPSLVNEDFTVSIPWVVI